MNAPALRLVLALLVALPALAACDTADLDTVENLVLDAQIARQAGRVEQAVRLLEQAHAAAPANPVVRTELAQTLLQREGLGLMDIDRIASHLMAAGGVAPLAPTGTAAALAKGAACSYATDPAATPFDPLAVENFPRIDASRETVRRTLELLAPVVPAQLRTITACSGVQDGRLVYDRAGAAAHLRGLGFTDPQIASTLAVNAVARFFNAYYFVADELAPQTSWYHVRRPGRTAVGVCAADPERLRQDSEAAIRDLGETLGSLDLRATTFGAGSASMELVNLLLDTYEEFRHEIGPYCAGGR